MAHLYAKTLKPTVTENQFIEPATMVTGSVSIDIQVNPVNEIIDSSPTKISYISYNEYIRDIESMCKSDKMFMHKLKSFCESSTEEEDEKSTME
jgi:hypothetical protein